MYNRGSSTIENKANWYVNRYRQLNQFAGTRAEEEETEEEDGENRGLADLPLAMFSSYFVSVSRYRNTQGSQSATLYLKGLQMQCSGGCKLFVHMAA